MYRDRRLQTYVAQHVAEWIEERARQREVGVSIVIRDLLFAAWRRELDSQPHSPGTDPERHKVFVTVALDAILTNHPDETLRERTIAAYHGRLEKLGMIPPRPKEDKQRE